MSSMIPIFLMPIAVLNSIHILSSLHDQLSQFKTRAEAVRGVMGRLFNAMLFTSITTVVGFASLSTTGIPPVVAFGLTVAFGVSLAWLLSILFIPAYFLLLPEGALRSFGQNPDDRRSVLMEVVQMFKGIACHSPRVVILAAVATLAISYVGLTRITINDNPVRWFKEEHVLRKADRVMNRKLAGTYMANLYFSLPAAPAAPAPAGPAKAEDEFAESAFAVEEEGAAAPSIRDPQVIAYMSRVNDFLQGLRDEEGRAVVGGVTSIVDILRKVGGVALGDASLPDTREKVSQYMFLFESGDRKKGRDMWKFITPGDSRTAQMWIQMKSGDNQTMTWVMDQLRAFMRQNPPPVLENAEGGEEPLRIRWSGLTHINNVWQDEMVKGMAKALAGAFLIVFVMMALLFRSLRWGLVAMLPLTLTIMMIYGAIGFSGKFYDMPIAVLSSLTLGLSIDFAIHFIEAARRIRRQEKTVLDTLHVLFHGTGRAIWRNVLVISVGFMPLFFATLVPYVTVGSFFFGIMLASGITTLILLSAILLKFHRWLPGMQLQHDS
jgi:predicted RND superfamily exporter protein